MNREEFDRIANDALDGVATPVEKEALTVYLADHPEARERFREWNDLFDSLKEVGLEESPSDLRPSVMRAIEAPRRPAGSQARRPDGWIQNLLRVPSWRPAFAFASGACVGAAAIALVAGYLVGGARYDSSDLSGAMMPRGARLAGAPVETRTLSVDGTRVLAGTRRTPDGVILRIEASGDGANGAELVATFDGGTLRPEALRQDPPSAGNVEIGPNRVRIGFVGEGAFTLSLRTGEARPAPLELELRSGARTSRATLRTDSKESTKR